MQIFAVASFYALLYFGYRISSLNMIKEVRTNFRLFPKHYALPPRWVRKFFGLKKDEIPKYTLVRLYVALIFGIMVFISPFVCLFTSCNADVIYYMTFVPCLFVLPDLIVYIIVLHIFKKQ